MNRPEIFDRVREAFDRGRWVMMTDSDGAPQEITLDLKERPDDLLGIEFKTGFADPAKLLRAQAEQRALYEAGLGILSDDHGPAVPAQDEYSWRTGEQPEHDVSSAPGFSGGVRITRDAPVVGADGPFVVREPGPVVYEFALQDFHAHKRRLFGLAFEPVTLEQIDIVNAEGFNEEAVAAADWVHVYDAVTRERRTLKRPPADAVLTGLADVAADLRLASGGPAPASPPYNIFTGISGEVLANGMDPELPAQPAPGPLTSTDGLLLGDVLRIIWAAKFGGMGGMEDGELVRVLEAFGPGKDPEGEAGSVRVWWKGEDHQFHADRFAFVGRPDADDWMDWPGGENPVGDALVNLILRGCHRDDLKEWGGEHQDWSHAGHAYDIVRFRLVDMPTLTGDA